MARGTGVQAGFSLADQMFNPDKTRYLAGLVAAAWDGFDSDRFARDVVARLSDLELKQRITWMAECLMAQLPSDLPAAAPILRSALPPALDPTKSDDDFGDFIIAPLGDVVIALGQEDHPDLVLDLLAEITQRFSMEFQLRPMLNRWPDMTMERLADWSAHENYHVRRLVSEGTRPKLPWGQGITLDPARALPLLDRLHSDPTRYVTRSVANHLNDLTKLIPDLAMDRLEGWAKTGRQTDKELRWMTGHALRGQVKSGTPRALRMIGFDPDAPIEVVDLTVPAEARIGDALSFSATLKADARCEALVDYIFWRQRANGEMAPKVFKLKQLQLKPGQPVTLDKHHKLKADATTFRLYPGPHRISLQVNGRVLADADVTLR